MKLKYLYKRRIFLKFIPIFFSFIITCLPVLYFPPTYRISIQQFSFSILYVFFISLFLLIFFTGEVVLKNKKHGFFIALFVISYLIFRLNDLTHPLFFFLLLALFLVLEFFFARQNIKE